MTYNEDPGSKDKEGDLGIMDYDTSFINEFKLGIYAYEQFYNGTDVAGSRIAVANDIKTNYKNAVKDTFKLASVDDIPTVKLSVFDELKAVAKDETDENGKAVIESASLVFPRNIIYNKYLNRHAVFFIEDDSAHDNFVNYKGKNILCANGDPTKPIIAVRASSGGEQEIHLMVVNRSPFVATDANGVSLTNYYTTFYPAQDFYPTDENGKKLDTYVNFLTNEASDTKNRAEEFASKLKSYNSDKLGKYIFLKYMQEEGIEFKDSALKDALMKWIKTSVEKSAEEKEESWTKTWNEYIDKLVRQNSERTKLVPQACRLGFKYANDKTNKTFKDLVTAGRAEIAAMDAGAEKDKANAIFENMLLDIRADLFEREIIDENTEVKALNYLDTLIVSNEFKTEGGLCNDGKTHL